MSQQLTVKENLSQIQELLGKITPEKWAWGQSMTDTREENINWFVTALDTHNEGGGKLQLVITENEEKTICIVGNGPAGEANAQFIASAPDIVRFLLSLVEQEEALIKKAVEIEREACVAVIQAAIDSLNETFDDWWSKMKYGADSDINNYQCLIDAIRARSEGGEG